MAAIPSSPVFRGFVQRRKWVQQLPSSNFSSRTRLGRLFRRTKKIHRSAANHNFLRHFLNFLGCGKLGGARFGRAFYTPRRRRGGRSFLFRVQFLPVKTTQAGAGDNGKCGKTAHNDFLCLRAVGWMKTFSKSSPMKNLVSVFAASRKTPPFQTLQEEGSPHCPPQKQRDFFALPDLARVRASRIRNSSLLNKNPHLGKIPKRRQHPIAVCKQQFADATADYEELGHSPQISRAVR